MLNPHNPLIEYVRVTEILKPFRDLSFVKPEYLAYKADLGTRTHKFCEQYVLHTLIDEVDHDCKGYFDSFKNWYDRCVNKLIFSEKRCFDDELKLTGQIDFVVNLHGDNDLTLVDIKTSKQSYPTYKLQTAAYLELLKNCYAPFISRRLCILLDANGRDPKIVEYLDHERDLDMFMCAYELYHFLK